MVIPGPPGTDDPPTVMPGPVVTVEPGDVVFEPGAPAPTVVVVPARIWIGPPVDFLLAGEMVVRPMTEVMISATQTAYPVEIALWSAIQPTHPLSDTSVRLA